MIDRPRITGVVSTYNHLDRLQRVLWALVD
jgi:hypothetical protein